MTPITKYVVGYCIISNKTLHNWMYVPIFESFHNELNMGNGAIEQVSLWISRVKAG